MPVIPAQSLDLEPDAIRVLVTGFGPFSNYKDVNPSWLAVRPLQNTILFTQSPAIPVTHNSETVDRPPSSSRQIHLTTLEIPTVYEAVLSRIPGLHKSPPVLPVPSDPSLVIPSPPEKGYDFIMHVGVAGPGPLRLEQKAHKLGYDKPDAEKKFAPVVAAESDQGDGKISQEDQFERDRLRFVEAAAASALVRGFAEGYEEFSKELHTQIDVDALLKHLQDIGIEPAYISTDAGRYLCDFIYYCSLAEAERTARKRATNGNTPTPVFFLHCCPPDQPYSTEAVTDAIKRIVVWISASLQ